MGTPKPPPSLLPIAAGFYGGLSCLAIALGHFLGHSPLSTLSWGWRDALAGVCAALPPATGFQLLLRAPSGPDGGLRRLLLGSIRPLFAGRATSELALLAGLAGLGEELLFRGLLQGELQRRLGGGLGLAAASVVFGVSHPFSAAYVVVAALLGAYLGWLWRWSGNLLAPVVGHAVYDGLALWMLARSPDPDHRS